MPKFKVFLYWSIQTPMCHSLHSKTVRDSQPAQIKNPKMYQWAKIMGIAKKKKEKEKKSVPQYILFCEHRYKENLITWATFIQNEWLAHGKNIRRFFPINAVLKMTSTCPVQYGTLPNV